MKQNKLYNVAIYCRLSLDDGNEGDSSSIKTQKIMLEEYVKEKGFNIYDYYIDDGFSGLNFNRPAFKRMIKDIEAGFVNLVITKDLSRLGRDYIMTGYYNEIFFPSHDVRYISINDNVDTLYDNNDIAPFKNILNDMYAKDISRKVKSAKRLLMQKGMYMASQPPYGYKKDPNDKNHLVIDEEAGKTTLTKLLLKLYEPEEGTIKINNIDYKDLSAYDVREKSSIILQNFQIYSATVLENVLMREKRYNDEEEVVINALKKVGLYEKIMTFPNGINTILTKEFSNEGIELSGGERQKLAVARVFASRSQIAILDEPTSALDPYSEKEINDDIIKMVDTKTVIIISHRLSTIVNVDRIYVMKDGKIEEYGTHDELMKQNGIYYEMFTAQAELYKE